MSCISITTIFMCSGRNGYLRMLGIEDFSPKTRILQV